MGKAAFHKARDRRGFKNPVNHFLINSVFLSCILNSEAGNSLRGGDSGVIRVASPASVSVTPLPVGSAFSSTRTFASRAEHSKAQYRASPSGEDDGLMQQINASGAQIGFPRQGRRLGNGIRGVVLSRRAFVLGPGPPIGRPQMDNPHAYRAGKAWRGPQQCHGGGSRRTRLPPRRRRCLFSAL